MSDSKILKDVLKEVTSACLNSSFFYLRFQVISYNDIVEIIYDPNENEFNFLVNSDEIGPFYSINEFTTEYKKYFNSCL